MKCYQCGHESEQDFTYCPACGFAAPEPAPTAVATTLEPSPILLALKEPLFLVLCILMSVACVLSISAGNMPLLNILLTVFLWLTYAQAKKDIVDANHLRSVSGTVFAQYVIVYVLAGLMVLLGVIFALAFGYLMEDPTFQEALQAELAAQGEEAMAGLSLITSVGGTLFAVVFILIAIFLVVINIFSMRYIHRFAQSVYRSVESGRLELKHTQATTVWLCIIGGISVISALSSLTSVEEGILPLLAAVAEAGCAIIPVLLINKHLK